jgi:hypothetical protein
MEINPKGICSSTMVSVTPFVVFTLEFRPKPGDLGQRILGLVHRFLKAPN